MSEVIFNHPDEFIEELGRDEGRTDDGIVRVTGVRRMTRLHPLAHYALVATFLRRGQVVRLDCYCGDLCPHMDEENAKTVAKSKEQGDKVHAAAERLGLDVRSGILSAAKPAGAG